MTPGRAGGRVWQRRSRTKIEQTEGAKFWLRVVANSAAAGGSIDDRPEPRRTISHP